MNLITALALVLSVASFSLALVKIVSMIWGKDIKKACSIKFAEIVKDNKENLAEVYDSGAVRRGECMETFKILKDKTQANDLNIASLQTEMKNLSQNVNEKIDELKADFKELSKFIRENFRAKQRK